MKKTYHILLYIATLCLALAACQDGNDWTGYTPSLEKKTSEVKPDTIKDDTIVKKTSALPVKIDIGYPNDTICIINVKSNEEWTATQSENVASWGWKVDQSTITGNGTVTVTVTKNPTDKQRSSTVTILGADSKKGTSVTINQPGIKLEVSTPTTFPSSEGSQDLTVSCNTDEWTATSSDESICTVKKKDNKTLTVSVKENTATTERKATVTVQVGDVKRTIDITQTGSETYIYIDAEKNRPFGKDGGEQTIKVSTNDGPFEVSSDHAWCEVKDTKADSFIIDVKENGTFSKRTATITVKSKSGKTDTLEVTQEANGIEREDYGDDEKKI